MASQASIKRTKKPVIGGALILASAVLGALGILNYAIGFGPDRSGFGKGDIPPFVPSIIFGMPEPALILAGLAFIGGIFAIKRKSRQWALSGAIAAALSFVLLGVPAVVLVALSLDEFAPVKKKT